MLFSEYQDQAAATAIYPRAFSVFYPALGLAGEAGEVSNKVKKVYRDHGGDWGTEAGIQAKEALKGEIGDCLWYLAGLCRDLGISLQEAAAENIAKLLSRKDRGTLGGSGDNR